MNFGDLGEARGDVGFDDSDLDFTGGYDEISGR